MEEADVVGEANCSSACHAPILPQHWVAKQSSRYPNRCYYFNTKSGETTWELPRHTQASKSGSNGKMHSKQQPYAIGASAYTHQLSVETFMSQQARGHRSEQELLQGDPHTHKPVPMDVDIESAVLEAYRGIGQRETHSAKSAGLHFGYIP